MCAGLRATEAKSINLSLTTLGMCINARADPNATHVPFRDSKLTRLLQVGPCLLRTTQTSLPLCKPAMPACTCTSKAEGHSVGICALGSGAAWFLQESLGGNAKTSLVIAVSDAVDHVDETLQSLQFGVRAMCVKIQVSARLGHHWPTPSAYQPAVVPAFNHSWQPACGSPHSPIGQLPRT